MKQTSNKYQNFTSKTEFIKGLLYYLKTILMDIIEVT